MYHGTRHLINYYTMVALTWIICIVVVLFCIGLIGFLIWNFITNRRSKEVTKRATVYVKRDYTGSYDNEPFPRFDYEDNHSTFDFPFWQKILEWIHYDNWRPQCFGEHACVVFNIEGHNVELSIPLEIYAEMIEGEVGLLTYKGERFIKYQCIGQPQQTSYIR